MLVEGLLHGGAAQAVGGALLEEFLYDAEGNPLASTFMDYLVPTAAEVPEMEVVISEDAAAVHNALGVKGAGEGGITGLAAAVHHTSPRPAGDRIAKGAPNAMRVRHSIVRTSPLECHVNPGGPTSATP